MKVIIESAIELTQDQQDKLAAKINSSFEEKNTLVFQVDSNVIGGIRIVTPHKTVDLSLAAKLNQLDQALQKS